MKIINSRKSAVKEGKHYILMMEEKEPSLNQISKAIKQAVGFAKIKAEDQRYRIAFNSQGERHSDYFHIHIILPKGKDQLPRIVDKLKMAKNGG